MSIVAITRLPSPDLGDCELTHLDRTPIDVARALEQHAAYRAELAACGARVEVLPALEGAPDATFVEDVAVVMDELAVICSMGAASRRVEPQAIREPLARYRELRIIKSPAWIDGGDVQLLGRELLVGESARTKAAGVSAMAEAVAPFGYSVRPVPVTGCLHLKSACTALPDGRLLVNPAWIDTRALEGLTLLPIPASEPWAADILSIGGKVVMGAPHPDTAAMLEGEGYEVRVVDLSEFAKAEAGVTCLSLVFPVG